MNRLIDLNPEIIAGVLINLFGLCLALIVYRYVSRHFMWTAKVNSYRFNLFNIRDRLNCLVVSGEVKEDSILYTFFINFLNDNLRIMNHHSTILFIKCIIKMSNNEAIQKDYKEFCEALKDNKKVEDLYKMTISVIIAFMYDSNLLLRTLFFTFRILKLQIKVFTQIQKAIYSFTPPQSTYSDSSSCPKLRI